FYYGNPADYPFAGDWNCDGVDTPGLYRQSDGYVYLRNTNTQGIADVSFYFGDPGDVPFVGDFNGDGCDTVSIYRPSNQTFYIINELGTSGGGLGPADYSYLFGNPGDQPFVGDFNGDGRDTPGLHRATTGLVYYRNTNTTGIADNSFIYGNPGDRFISGDWTGNGIDSPGLFRPSNTTTYLRYENSQGNADASHAGGFPSYMPVAGRFGELANPPPSCPTFPEDNIWNRRVDDLPVDARSSQYIAAIGANETLHADFGSGVWPPGSTSPIGIPFVNIAAGEPDVEIIYTAWGNESDPGPFPIPADAPIEGGPDASGDRHVIVVDREECVLYELYRAFPLGNGSWSADSGATYDLRSNDLRPDGWTSADAAGLPIYPGLVTYDEVASGAITHAIRFTASDTRSDHVWPARHDSSSITASNYPPMGQRFRLKADYDISRYPAEIQVILQAFKVYGLILADNGSSWSISGAPDERWNNQVLHAWDDIPGSAFEAVDVSSLMVDPNSGKVGR
ncbi:MAG: hypothetical protein M8861_08780, partial [marine benthic group bacterium]|nr:hypothetical protein [Gemmatimonadota bacterium]